MDKSRMLKRPESNKTISRPEVSITQPKSEPAKPQPTPSTGVGGSSLDTMVSACATELMNARTSIHKLHLKVTGEGSFAAHTALNAYYDAIPDMIDSLVEAYQGKHGILKGYTPAEKFDDFDKANVIKYFKGLATYIERCYDKLDPKDTNIINQLDTFKDLIYTTIYKLENLQ